MAENVFKLQLNQQQLELLDRTIARGVAEAKAKPNDQEPLR